MWVRQACAVEHGEKSEGCSNCADEREYVPAERYISWIRGDFDHLT